MTDLVIDDLAKNLEGVTTYFDDPEVWLEERIGEIPWSKEREIMRSVRDNRRTSVKSCHGTGKSFTAARLTAWWISRAPIGEAIVVTTAPSHRQVKAILWQEVAKAYKRGELIGHLNQTEWWVEKELVGLGFKPADYDPDAFQGFHRKYVLVIFDEASGIPPVLWEAANSLLINDNARFLAIGNPTDPTSEFARVCKPGSGWNTIHIGHLDTPNFSGEEVSDDVAKVLIDEMWVNEAAKDYGVDSAYYTARVLGEFPKDSDDGVVPNSAVQKCLIEKPLTDDELFPVELGVDVGAGGDESVIQERRGRRAGRQWHKQTPDSMQLVGEIVNRIKETGAIRVKVDVIGIGWAVVGRLKELKEEGTHNAEIIGVNVGNASDNPEKFVKLRDQLWWEVGRENSINGYWDLSGLPEEVKDQTITQLVAPNYSADSKGRIKIEPKEETRKRIGRSPDNADGLLLAFYSPYVPPPAQTYGEEIAEARI